MNAIPPLTIRLPKPGTLCPVTGLARSALNELILPCPANDFSPPVKSFSLRRKGARRGIRLVDFQSLESYIRQHADRHAAKSAA